MKDEDRFGGYTPWRATRFYVPLLIQAFSQCLTYPLVAAIVSHGPTGVSTLTAFAQGQTVMFLIGAIGGGLVMTGMVFARTRAGYLNFIRLNTWMMAVLLAIQLTLRRFRGIYLMDAQEGVRGPLRIVRLRGEEEVLERTGIVCLNAAAVLV